MKVTVLGATGKTGGGVVDGLLAAGAQVNAVARSAEKLAALGQRGAQTTRAAIDDAGALAKAMQGSDGVYAMIPGDYHKPDLLGQYARAGEAIAHAVQSSGVRRVVLLSSLGAELPSGTGPIAGLHAVETRLRAIPALDLLILRPGYFYENHFGTMPLIQRQGINGGVIQPDVAMATIAARDAGVEAARAMAGGDVSGVVVRDLTGPREITMAEATRLLGRAIGQPELAYVRFSDEDYVKGLQASGFAPDAARLFLEMAQAFNAGRVGPQPGQQRVRGATTFESFADTYGRAYRASSGA